MADTDQTQNSVTLMLRRFGSGDAEATRILFEIYFARLTRLAQRFLPSSRRRSRDEEDLAQEVLASFLMGMSPEELAKIQNRHHLWNLLARRIHQRAINVQRDDGRLKRGGGQLLTESKAFRDGVGAFDPKGIEQFTDDSSDSGMEEPLAELEQLHRRLIDVVKDEKLNSVARALLSGNTASQIASNENVSLATVYRRIERIRRIWTDLPE